MVVQGRELWAADIDQIRGMISNHPDWTRRLFHHLLRQHHYLGHGQHVGETFVDRSRFIGTCYRAANWRLLGQTTGRTRQDKDRRIQVPHKDLYVYVLNRRFREVLCR